jgi:hypothetical protein
MIKTCGNCVHGKVHSNDLTKRICRGAPPTPILFPAGPGKVQMQFHFPLMEAMEEGCGMHKAKSLLDTPEGNA